MVNLIIIISINDYKLIDFPFCQLQKIIIASDNCWQSGLQTYRLRRTYPGGNNNPKHPELNEHVTCSTNEIYDKIYPPLRCPLLLNLNSSPAATASMHNFREIKSMAFIITWYKILFYLNTILIIWFYILYCNLNYIYIH